MFGPRMNCLSCALLQYLRHALALLTCEPVEKESNTGPMIGYITYRHDNPSHYSLSIFISHLNILEDGKLTYQLLALAFVLSNVFSPCSLLFQCLLSSSTYTDLLFSFFCFSLSMLIIFEELLVAISRELRMPQ